MPNKAYSYRQIWKISYPIIIGLVAQNMMLVIDTAFLGRVSEITLGAAAIGGVFYLCMVMFGTGFSIGAQIMIGRRNGQGKLKDIGQIFDTSIGVLLLIVFLLWLFLQYPGPKLLTYIINSEAVLEESLKFINFRKYGLLFGFLVLGFNALYVGNTQTQVLSLSTLVMASINIVLDYILIFGKYGFPEMGISGAALATNIAEFVTFLFYVFWVLKTNDVRKYSLFQFRIPHIDLLKRLLSVSVPVMFQYFFSFAAWFVFFLIIEQIGETALAASNITRSIYMVLMIPVWGLSAAVNTMVSNTIGNNKPEWVLPIITKVFFTGLICNVLLVQVLVFMPLPIIRFYTQDPGLIEATLPLLKVISVALIAFSFGMILFNGLSGTGKTLLALKIEIFSITLYLIATLFIAIVLQATVEVVWLVEILYFSLMGLFAFWALKRGKWKELDL